MSWDQINRIADMIRATPAATKAVMPELKDGRAKTWAQKEPKR